MKRCKWIFFVRRKIIIMLTALFFMNMVLNKSINTQETYGVTTEIYLFLNNTICNTSNEEPCNNYIDSTMSPEWDFNITHDNNKFNFESVLNALSTESIDHFNYSDSQFMDNKIQNIRLNLSSSEIALNKNLTIWPTKHVANMEGDIILGGLMMVHEREDTIICGPIMAQGGIQALETMLFTLDYINNAGLLPNISLGAHVLDDCDKGTFDFIILNS